MIMEQEQKSIMGRCGSSPDQPWGDGPIKGNEANRPSSALPYLPG